MAKTPPQSRLDDELLLLLRQEVQCYPAELSRIKELIKKGAAVNGLGDRSPLRVVLEAEEGTFESTLEIVTLLIEGGANPMKPDPIIKEIMLPSRDQRLLICLMKNMSRNPFEEGRYIDEHGNSPLHLLAAGSLKRSIPLMEQNFMCPRWVKQARDGDQATLGHLLWKGVLERIDRDPRARVDPGKAWCATEAIHSLGGAFFVLDSQGNTPFDYIVRCLAKGWPTPAKNSNAESAWQQIKAEHDRIVMDQHTPLAHATRQAIRL